MLLVVLARREDDDLGGGLGVGVQPDLGLVALLGFGFAGVDVVEDDLGVGDVDVAFLGLIELGLGGGGDGEALAVGGDGDDLAVQVGTLLLARDGVEGNGLGGGAVEPDGGVIVYGGRRAAGGDVGVEGLGRGGDGD